jgi:hypothetical protein
MCSDYKLQSIDLSKITREFVKATGLGVRIFGANLCLLMEVPPKKKQCC